jgi:uncharacterized coiled-coil protein SlyX
MMRECAHEACGETFEAKRADARFCSASCRAAASRMRRSTGNVSTPGDEQPTPRVSVAVAGQDPEIATQLDSLEARVESLVRRIVDAQAKAERELAGVARELGFDRDNTNEHLADLVERVEALERAAKARPERMSVNTHRLEGRIGEVEVALRKLNHRLDEQDARLTGLDEAAAAAITMLAETG